MINNSYGINIVATWSNSALLLKMSIAAFFYTRLFFIYLETVFFGCVCVCVCVTGSSRS